MFDGNCWEQEVTRLRGYEDGGGKQRAVVAQHLEPPIVRERLEV